MRATLLVSASALILSFASHTLAASPDHPLLSRYPEATVRSYERIAYERFSLPAGPVDEETKVRPTLDLVGNLTRHYYQIGNLSTLKVAQNYKAALSRAGFNLIYECEHETCGADDQVKALGGSLAIPGTVYNDWRNPHYLLAESTRDGGNTYVALFIGAYGSQVSVQQVVLEEVPAETDLVNVDMELLGKPPELTDKTISDEDRAQDSPLLSRYPGAKLERRRTVGYEKVTLPASPLKGSKPFTYDKLEVLGDMMQHNYKVWTVSTLKIYENYKSALEKAGFDLLVDCQLEDCGNRDQAKQLGSLLAITGNVYNHYHKPYYLLAQRDTPNGPAYAAIFMGSYESSTDVHQIIVQTTEAQTDLITINADDLYDEIEQAGKALIYGIYFDTDKAAIKDESAPALQAITELLDKHAGLKLYVVGHTDDTGSVQHNQSLSSARAKAVVDRLIQSGIAATRLSPVGVGPHAPQGSNDNEAGRTLNRRVELVKRLN